MMSILSLVGGCTVAKNLQEGAVSIRLAPANVALVEFTVSARNEQLMQGSNPPITDKVPTPQSKPNGNAVWVALSALGSFGIRIGKKLLKVDSHV